MVGCCAFKCCNNSSGGHKMYSIPKGINDQIRREIWLSRINRKDFPPNGRLCEAHFDPDQFEPKIPGKLKPNAIPSIFAHRTEPYHRKLPKERKSTVSAFLDCPTIGGRIRLDHAYVGKAEVLAHDECKAVVPVHDGCSTSTSPAINPSFMSSRVTAVIDPRLPPTWEDIAALKRKLDLTRKKLYKVQKEKEELEKKYSQLFNTDQVNFLKQSTNRPNVPWSDETIEKALHLRFSCGTNGYNMMLALGFPFPSDRTLRRKLQQVSSDSEIVTENLNSSQ